MTAQQFAELRFRWTSAPSVVFTTSGQIESRSGSHVPPWCAEIMPEATPDDVARLEKVRAVEAAEASEVPRAPWYSCLEVPAAYLGGWLIFGSVIAGLWWVCTLPWAAQ